MSVLVEKLTSAHCLQLFVLGLLLVSLMGCSGLNKRKPRAERSAEINNYIVVTRAPPTRKVQSKPVRPSSNAVWISGHWRWKSKGYVWSRGYWDTNPKGRNWVAGRWIKKGRGWIWSNGHWV